MIHIDIVASASEIDTAADKLMWAESLTCRDEF